MQRPNNARVKQVRDALYGFDVSAPDGLKDLRNLAAALTRIADDVERGRLGFDTLDIPNDNDGPNEIEGAPV